MEEFIRANCACRCKGSGGAAGEKLVTLAELRDSEMRAAQQDVQNSQQFTMHLAKIEARLQTLEDSSRLANDRLKILQAASARAKHEAGRMMKDYDDDNTGVIDYRKFCENVMGSHPDDAGGWGSSSSGSNARIPGADKAKKRYEEKKRKKEARRKAKAPSDHPLGGGDEGTGLDLMGTGLSIASQSMQLQTKDTVHVRRHPSLRVFVCASR